VRVFKTSEAKDKTVSLPFEETINGLKNYYYYQVIEGNIMIAIDVYGTKINPAQKSLFKTVIFNETSITDLEKTGKNKVDLMNLPYNDVINLNIK
ncbi:MAG: hypothetical protein ACXWCZ_08240, partial [Flavisolibacter sp.]